MRFTVQLIVEADNQRPIVTELARVKRSGFDAGNLGLHINEARTLLAQLQRTMVQAQADAFITEASVCAGCHRPLGRKGEHKLVYRTVFGKLRLRSPRLYRCPKCHAGRTSFSPVPACLPPLWRALRLAIRHLQVHVTFALEARNLGAEELSELNVRLHDRPLG